MKNVKNLKYIHQFLIYFSICSLIGLFFVGQEYYYSVYFDKHFKLIEKAAYQLSYTYSWGVLIPLIILIAKRMRLEWKNLKKALPPHIVAGIILAVSQKTISVFGYLVFINQSISPDVNVSKIFLKIFGGSFDSFIIYWLIIGVYYGYDYYIQYKKQKLVASQLETELATAQLQALKMQLQPHFLFNTLHTISSLMDDDITLARKMIARLSDLLRQTLDHIGVQEVTLKKEVEFLKNYLEIEQTRFNDRLRVTYKIDSETMDYLVPNLILQPLVENAVKHGISPKASGGDIIISAALQGNQLRLQVSDNGNGNHKQAGQTGVGLSNIRNRLFQLYGKDHLMTVESDQSRGFSVTILIPLKKETGNGK